MSVKLTSPASCRRIARFTVTMFAAFLFPPAAFAQPFTVQGPGVHANGFRITTFATGLDFRLGMAKLSDGSLLVAISQGANFFSSTGSLVRLVDTNQDGIADGAGTGLYSGLPGSQTAVRVGGNRGFVTSQTKPITVLRSGGSPSDPLTLVGRIIINYP